MAAAGWPAQLQAFSTLSLSSAGAESVAAVADAITNALVAEVLIGGKWYL
jgi:hypothetical protein